MIRTTTDIPDLGFRQAPEVEVLIEIPRWSFVKRGTTGRVDFVSPLPCPFNYGSVPQYIGLDGDLLDALVLGPRLPRGTHVKVRAFAAFRFTDRGMTDDKLICCDRPPTESDYRHVARFFRVYARCKGVLNWYRGHHGRNASDGWADPQAALMRARCCNGDSPARAAGRLYPGNSHRD